MADKKISQLASLSPVGTSDLVPVVDSISGETRHVTVDDLRSTGVNSAYEVALDDSGDHTNFTIPDTPLDGTFRLYRGGARQQYVVDYTRTGSSLTLNVPLADGETLFADYSFV